MLAISFVFAIEHYVTDIGYYDESGTHTIYYTQVPSATVTKIGVKFTAAYPITQLQYANFYHYNAVVGTPTAVLVEVFTPDVNGYATGVPLASVQVPRASITANAWNSVNLTSFNLSFAAGQQFIICLSAVGGTATTACFQFFLDRIASTEFPSHSMRYRSGAWELYQGFTIGGVANSGGEYFISATVNYNAPYHDVAAQSLWFTGDLLLAQGTSVEYEADVKNTGDQNETNIPVTIEIADITYPARTVVFTDTQYITSLAAGDSIHVNTFSSYTYNTPGEYIVTLYTGLGTDMNPDNDAIYLEQQVVVLPANLTYDDGTADSAWAPNVALNEFANEFECPVGPFKVNQLQFHVWDVAWPTPGTTDLGIVVYDDDGLDVDGNPNAPGTELYYQQVTVTRGAWNTFDVSAGDIILPGGKFFVAARFLQAYPNCPGLSVDNNPPWSSWKVSWEKSGTDWYQSYPDYNEDWMIRAGVDYIEFWPPEDLAIYKVGNDAYLEWGGVPAANSYDVFQGTDPANVTTEIASNIANNNYTHVNGALSDKSFYYVKASTQTAVRTHHGMIPFGNNTAKTRLPMNAVKSITSVD